jgi:alpha-galactosidase
MVPIKTSWSIRYRIAGDGSEHRVTIDEQGDARPAEDARELGIEIVRGGGADYATKRARICPACDLEVSSISVTLLDMDVLGAGSIFLNGFNSWTDSVERSPLARTRGLNGVPTAVINRWVLDNSGDYRFVKQAGLPGGQHGIGYGYLRYGDRVLLFGSLDEDTGFTVVRESARTNAIKLEKEPLIRVHKSCHGVPALLEQAVSFFLNIIGNIIFPVGASGDEIAYSAVFLDIEQIHLGRCFHRILRDYRN